MAKFRTRVSRSTTPESPSSLFHDLSTRSDEIKYLWAHQKEILDAYHAHHQGDENVAIELPTGAGKTLVGLLIAEYRRRRHQERIAYLCPTRQLARQVGNQATSYGIPAHVFVGRQRSYNPSEFASYQQGQSIAVTTYSGVFNSNPRIDSPQVLLFDDAHSCETYVTRMWSLELQRESHLELFGKIVALFRDWLPESFIAISPDDGYSRVELIPGTIFRSQAERVIELCDKYIESETPEWYALGLLREHLHGCVCFLTAQIILIRPIVPPTRCHAPFADATQRLYMSATLGIADAVAAEIAAGEFSQTITPERRLLPRFELKDLMDLQVTVVPKAAGFAPFSRDATQCDYDIDVAVQKKVGVDMDAELPDLLALVDELVFFLRKRPLAQLGHVQWIKTVNEPIYAPEHLQSEHVFTSVITLTYRVLR